MKKTVHHLLLALIILVLPFWACKSDVEPVVVTPPPPTYETAVLWADMTLFVSKKTASNSPTYASRALGYIGLTMYETVVNGSKIHQSLSGQLADMPILTKPDAGKKYNWVIAKIGRAHV